KPRRAPAAAAARKPAKGSAKKAPKTAPAASPAAPAFRRARANRVIDALQQLPRRRTGRDPHED
ncbi:MAG TPA: hypothetical protein VLF18_19725, partial [Tahibacter sp.]|uniref:hypothetical protein n=1 Tax=Tahibacter sp. TaxID=2056211 RepID=UPI002B74208B